MILNKNYQKDVLTPFTLNGSKIRGKIVRLSDTTTNILKKHKYPRNISLILSEIMANCCCLSSTLKFNGKFTLQMSAQGSIKTLMSDLSSNGALRAYASFDKEKLKSYKTKDFNNLKSIMNKGYIAFTTSLANSSDRYQGITTIEEGGLVNSILNYFKNSEQIETEIRSFTSSKKECYQSGAIIIQKMPDTDLYQENFAEAKLFLQSLQTDEFFAENNLQNILYKLFNKFSIRVHKNKIIRDFCSCNVKKVQDTIKKINKKDLKKFILPNGNIEVVCEFCKNKNIFNGNNLELLTQ